MTEASKVVFISHNHADKPVVSHFARPLAEHLGRDNVFYDSWSIQPGEDIIGRMDEGLARCDTFFFFVSKNSLKSGMVKLEWQSALMRKAQRKLRFIPVKMDESDVPAILISTAWIDLYSQGAEIALRQVLDVVKGQNVYRPDDEPMENLQAYFFSDPHWIIVEVRAQYFIEHNSSFLLLLENPEEEVYVHGVDAPGRQNFKKDLPLTNGQTCNGVLIELQGSTKPGFPITIRMQATTQKPVKVLGILHAKTSETYRPIPLTDSEPPQ